MHPLTARSMPPVNVAIKRRDAELGQQAALKAFGRPARVAPLGARTHLRQVAGGVKS